ncbi:MAG TPA: ABC transporter permease [Micromonosporaceae bacterium]
MTYPDDRTGRLGNEGLRVQPEYRQASGTPEGFPDEIDPYQPETQLALPGPRALTSAELDTAFDDPDHGEPGRDRFAVHLIWEFVLLLAAAGVAFAVSRANGNPLGGDHLKTLMVDAAVLGVLGLAAGLSLRAAAVNLAIGPIFVLSGLYYAHYSPDGFYAAAGIAVGIALGCGLVIAVLVTAFQVPSWAASLAMFAGILLWQTRLAPTEVLTTHYNPSANGYYWFGTFAVVALVGSVLGLIRPVRRWLGRFRPIGDPADRRGAAAAVVAGLALLGSALLAGIAGVASVMQIGAAVSNDGITYTGLAIGIALLGGVSAFGRRGGIFGTILATALVGLAIDYVTLHAWRGGTLMVITAALGVGVLVTRLIEAYGRPDRLTLREDPVASLSWLGRQQGSWTRELPRGEEVAYEEAPEERWHTR